VRGDYTRFSFRSVRHFVGVLLQQGRVQLDSDANETYTLLRRLLLFVEHSIDRGLQRAGFGFGSLFGKRQKRHRRLRSRR
jgi:hypothetical protein